MPAARTCTLGLYVPWRGRLPCRKHGCRVVRKDLHEWDALEEIRLQGEDPRQLAGLLLEPGARARCCFDRQGPLVRQADAVAKVPRPELHQERERQGRVALLRIPRRRVVQPARAGLRIQGDAEGRCRNPRLEPEGLRPGDVSPALPGQEQAGFVRPAGPVPFLLQRVAGDRLRQRKRRGRFRSGGNGVSVRPASQVWVRRPVVSVSSGDAFALASSVSDAGPVVIATAFSRVNPPVVESEKASVTETGELPAGTVTRCPPAALMEPTGSRSTRSRLVLANRMSASTWERDERSSAAYGTPYNAVNPCRIQGHVLAEGHVGENRDLPRGQDGPGELRGDAADHRRTDDTLRIGEIDLVDVDIT